MAIRGFFTFFLTSSSPLISKYPPGIWGSLIAYLLTSPNENRTNVLIVKKFTSLGHW